MSSFMIFEINNNLFTERNDDDDFLNLDILLQKMNEIPITFKENSSEVNGAGFYNVSLESYQAPSFNFERINKDSDEPQFKPIPIKNSNDKVKMISAEVTGQGSLGNYQQAYMDEDGLLTNKNAQQMFYTHASIKLLESNLLIIIFKMTSSEKIKGQIVSLFEQELGLDLTQLRIKSELLVKTRQHTDWQNIRLDQIQNDDDKTTSVHYAIDLSNETDSALMHEVYKDKGKMVQLTSAISYEPSIETLQTGAFTINLYQVGHRFSLLDAQFNNNFDEIKAFVLYFTFLLKNIMERNG